MLEMLFAKDHIVRLFAIKVNIKSYFCNQFYLKDIVKIDYEIYF